MTELRYSNGKSIDLEIGDLVLFRGIPQQKHPERAYFGKVYGVNVEKRYMPPDNLFLSPSFRLFTDVRFGGVEFPYYSRSGSNPAKYRAEEIYQIWKGSAQDLAEILREEFKLEAWAGIIEQMKPPYELELLEAKESINIR